MSDLENLILRLQKGVSKGAPYIKTIRNPPLLIKSLKQLHNMIGNNKIKESVAMQVSYLILNKHRCTNNNRTQDDVMLHCMLSGRAGLGKTTISVILAKIFYALGYLGNTDNNHDNHHDNQHDLHHLTETLNLNMNENNQFFSVFLFIILLWVIGLSWNFYNQYGGLLTLILLITLFIVVFAIFYHYHNQKIDIKNIKTNVKAINHVNFDENDLVRVVSRSDLVGLYVGSTAIKTKELLTSCIGKTLVLDECYSILNNPEDPFGLECLNTLNLFMSEHPNDILIIFAGYKHLIEKLFDAQPGLRRRIMWHYECIDYTQQELYDIFKFKLDQKKWKLEHEHDVRKLFDQYDDAFPNAGGDVERLLFFSFLEHANDFIKNDSDIDVNTLYLPQVERGMKRLIDNNQSAMESRKHDSDYDYSHFLNLFKRHKNEDLSLEKMKI
ncbi:MAG TPA: hypothetical protein VLG50_08245 [Candidatus Saccharimonadales bacterium]|nr:hypothetical protein [Candidatus Saccharimonadales bacterium]